MEGNGDAFVLQLRPHQFPFRSLSLILISVKFRGEVVCSVRSSGFLLPPLKVCLLRLLFAECATAGQL